MAGTKIGNSTVTDRTTGISAGSISAGAGLAGSAIDNSASGSDTMADFQLTFTLAATPVAGDPIYLYLLENLGTIEDGSTSVQPQRVPDAIFNSRAVSTAQVVSVQGVPLPPAAFTPLLWDGSLKAASSVTLLCKSYSRQSGS